MGVKPTPDSLLLPAGWCAVGSHMRSGHQPRGPHQSQDNTVPLHLNLPNYELMNPLSLTELVYTVAFITLIKKWTNMQGTA